jgi:hypothetical protein
MMRSIANVPGEGFGLIIEPMAQLPESTTKALLEVPEGPPPPPPPQAARPDRMNAETTSLLNIFCITPPGVILFQ